MQFLPCSINDAIYPALPRQAICRCTTDNCATKTCTALPPPFIAISVEHSDFLIGVHEVYKGLAMVSVGWLAMVSVGWLAVFFLGWTQQYQCHMLLLSVYSLFAIPIVSPQHLMSLLPHGFSSLIGLASESSKTPLIVAK